MNALQDEKVWLKKPIYDEAETKYYEKLHKPSLTPLADKILLVRQELIASKLVYDKTTGKTTYPVSYDPNASKFLEKKIVEFGKKLEEIVDRLDCLTIRVTNLEKNEQLSVPVHQIELPSTSEKDNKKKDDDDDVDLFGSDSEDENEAAKKIREERLAAYNAKKSKKPVLIAKSNVILDVKPWDDETDMEELEKCVRKIESDGLLWGTSKLVPLAYGIHKLQISCVVEDEKVSIDWLQDEILTNEDFVQSVDIAAFNKI